MTQSQEHDFNIQAEQPNRQAEAKRGPLRWLLREISGVIILAAILFLCAGRLDWPMAWALLGLYVVWIAANAIILMPRDPALLAERALRKKSPKRWDTVILGVYGFGVMAKYFVAALDVRFGWSESIPLPFQVVMFVLAALGYGLVTWAMASNSFFSMIYRIQAERDHAVASGGPYRYIRHPGYLGSALFDLATPIALGSWWAFIPGCLAALFMIIRTAYEDRTLQDELPGYAEYARRTRFRLLPGVW